MKTRFITVLLIALVAFGVSSRAATQKDPPAAQDELTVVIVESLTGRSAEISPYERLSRVFTQSFEARKWPLKINTERWAANDGEHPLELRVFFQGIRRDTPAEITFRGWMTFSAHGTKHDFGVIKYSYYPRPGQNMDDVLDATVRGAADMAAKKIDAILFQGSDAQKR